VQADHGEGKHVFPEEGGGEEVLAGHDLLPDSTGDHDRVKQQGLDQDRDGCGLIARAGGEVVQHQRRRNAEREELDRRQDALHQRPASRVAPGALSSEYRRFGCFFMRLADMGFRLSLTVPMIRG
jgi:hypothetical protein